MCLIFLKVLKFLFSFKRKLFFHWDFPRGHIQVYKKRIMYVCIQFAYICVDWVICSHGAFSFSSFLKKLNIWSPLQRKKSISSEKAEETTVKVPLHRKSSPLYKIPCLPVFYKILDGCGCHDKNNSCHLCARLAAVFTFLHFLLHLAAPRDGCYYRKQA